MGNVIAQATPILIGVFIFGLLILVHEWGHFIAARKNGVLVEEFAIGMGPKIFSVKPGETEYSLRLIPAGGFCKMLGDVGDDETSTRNPRSFCNKPVWRRMIIILAGAIMNLVLTLVLLTVIALTDGLATTTIATVTSGSPAEVAGFLPGDRVVKIDSTRTHIYEDLRLAMMKSRGRAVDITVEREGQTLVRSVVPEANGAIYIIGITATAKTGIFQKAEEGFAKAGIFESISTSFWKVGFWIHMTFFSLSELFSANVSVNDMSGPIGVVTIIGDTYEAAAPYGLWVTIRSLMDFTAILSASIGIFNLFPIPALDGGRFVFLLVEGIRRKPIAPEKEGMVHLVGFVLLIALGMFIAYNDILKIL